MMNASSSSLNELTSARGNDHDRHDHQGRPHHHDPGAVADTPWLKGHAFGEARNLLVLEVETKGGIVGMGYLFSFRPGLKTIVAALEELIIPHVIGKDATAVEGIWHEGWKRTVTYNRGGIVTMAMSALDIALWDAIGKRANMPLHRLWGHVRSQMPVYGSGLLPRLRRRRHDRQGAALQGAAATRPSRCRWRTPTTCAATSTTSSGCARRSAPTSTS